MLGVPHRMPMIVSKEMHGGPSASTCTFSMLIWVLLSASVLFDTRVKGKSNEELGG